MIRGTLPLQALRFLFYAAMALCGSSVFKIRSNAACNAQGVILLLPKPRENGLLNDFVGARICQDPLQPITDLDTHPAFVRGDNQENTVVLSGLANAPVPPQSDAVFFDGASLQAV